MKDEMEVIEFTIEQAKANIARMEALKKLHNISEFNEIFTEGYFKKEPARLAILLADPAVQSEKDQISIKKNIEGIGRLHQYLHGVMQLGYMSQRTLKENEMSRDEILAEEAGE